MSDKKIFIDTNIIIYLVKDNTGKAELIASKIIEKADFYISVQVLNEFCNIALKKLDFTYSNILFIINKFTENFVIMSIDVSTIKLALQIKEKYSFSYYDSLIVASALENKCSILYTEDMHHNQVIENSLTIINPFL
ncbi:MAG: PIN domain-containing protein [Bacteroidales bacterium]